MATTPITPPNTVNRAIMTLLTVHSIPLVREFQSTWISRATVFVVLCSALWSIAPLLVAYSTHGFWIKHQIHREHPNVNFKYEALLLARSPQGELTWSTSSRYNQLTNNYLVYPSITSSETDLNDDGLLDMLDLDLQVNTPNGTAFHFVQLLLIFSYQLKEVSHVTMEAMAMLQYDSGLPLATLNYVGDLQWVQRKVLSFQATDNRYNQSIIDQFEVADILLDYNARDYATEMRNEHCTPVFSPSPEGIGSLRIAARLRYAEAVLEYAPGFWNTLKWAWIQYVSILVIFLYVIGRIQDYVFNQQLVPSWNDKDLM